MSNIDGKKAVWRTQDHAVGSMNSWPKRLAWLPVPLFTVGIFVLSAAHPQTFHGSGHLLVVLNFVFLTPASLFIACLVGRSFLIRGAPGLLMLGCGVVSWGTSALVATSVGLRNPNTPVTIYNIGVWLSAFCHLAGVLLTERPRPVVRGARPWLLMTAYALALGAVGLVTKATLAGWIPTFFVQGHGGTPLRQVVIALAIGMFVFTGALLKAADRRSPSPFAYWYGLGLFLISVGLLGVMIQSAVGSALFWTGRAAQFLGGAYLLTAAIVSVRESGSWSIPLQEALRESEARTIAVLESIGDAFIAFDREWRFVYMNAAAQRTVYSRVGREREGLIGRNVWEKFPALIDAPAYENCQKAMTERVPVSFETYYPSLGNWYWIRVYPYGDGISAYCEDITERKRAEEALQEESRRVAYANRILELFVQETGSVLYDKVLDVVLEATESKHGVFGYIDEKGDLMCPTMSRLFDQCEMDETHKCICYTRQKWTGLWGRALTEGRTLYTNETPTVPPGHVPVRNNLATPILFHGEVIGLLNIANKEADYTDDDRELIDFIADGMAPVLYAWVQKELRENERAQLERHREELYQREHRIAELLQQALIPSQIPTRISGCDIATRYKPAHSEAAVGGDFYDVFDLGEGRIGVLIGDVVGKGLAAAMRVSAARYAIRSYAYLDPTPSKVMALANDALGKGDTDELSNMLTAFFAVVDSRTGTLTCASGGHEPPLLRRADGTVEELDVGGRALGVISGAAYDQISVKIEHGDMIVLVTDGITEARNGESEFFNAERLREHVAISGDCSVDELADGLLAAARAYANGCLQDDAAIVVVKVTEQECKEVNHERCSGYNAIRE